MILSVIISQDSKCYISLIDSVINKTVSCSHRDMCEKIAVIITDLCCEAQINFSDISKVVINNGPANFTAIRIAISFFSGLFLFSDSKIISVDSAFLLVSAVRHIYYNKVIGVLIENTDKECFFAKFKDLKQITSIEVINNNQIVSKTLDCDITLTNSDTLKKSNESYLEYINIIENIESVIKGIIDIPSSNIIQANYCKEFVVTYKK
jgi:tRNA A37 threonylcarbamoyladenosine modification protein TsaB